MVELAILFLPSQWYVKELLGGLLASQCHIEEFLGGVGSFAVVAHSEGEEACKLEAG